ncbi:MAG TPA: monovalent cation/H(+) antiporter subunit G [Terracidiphilus sp.]|nr:monovalent cation/H(+) antiporter subunit G [Terracidiphilus sp.]
MKHALELVSLSLLVAVCWIGCIGMLRMRNATQALHFLSLPAGIGGALLPLVYLCAAGWTSATAKSVAIAFFLVAANSVVTHATARAFRVRNIGHWQPHAEDSVEFPLRGKTK